MLDLVRAHLSLGLVATVAVVATLACTQAEEPTPGAPLAPPGTPASASTAQALPSPTPLPAFAPSTVPPVSEEQLREELNTARFSGAYWRTNFRIHSVPLREFRGGGPNKDDIPAIDRPRFETVEEADAWLDDREPVQTVVLNGDARAYPQQVLIWHELVNDTVGGVPVVITY